jgi:type I restriction enzyme R subunit
VVSNGDRARYGSITSKWEHFTEWKRNAEKDKGRVEAEVLLDGMLAKDRLLDLVESFILFDDSKPGGTRKVVARNHQVLGVNNAVVSMEYQQRLKEQIPPDRRLKYRVVELRREDVGQTSPLASPAGVPHDALAPGLALPSNEISKEEMEKLQKLSTLNPQPSTLLPIIERAHPDLGRLGVFWHTQGSGKSYSMVMFPSEYLEYSYRTPSQPLSSTYPTPI